MFFLFFFSLLLAGSAAVSSANPTHHCHLLCPSDAERESDHARAAGRTRTCVFRPRPSDRSCVFVCLRSERSQTERRTNLWTELIRIHVGLFSKLHVLYSSIFPCLLRFIVC